MIYYFSGIMIGVYYVGLIRHSLCKNFRILNYKIFAELTRIGHSSIEPSLRF